RSRSSRNSSKPTPNIPAWARRSACSKRPGRNRRGRLMRRFRPALLLLAIVSCSAPAPAEKGKVYRVYFLGGQSNMEGFGTNRELPEDFRGPVPGAFIFHGNQSLDRTLEDGRGLWAPLQPGHGVGFRSDGRANATSDRFGCELSLGRRLRELEPDTGVALIKYSREGTSIDVAAAGTWGCWDPDFAGVNQYDH